MALRKAQRSRKQPRSGSSGAVVVIHGRAASSHSRDSSDKKRSSRPIGGTCFICRLCPNAKRRLLTRRWAGLRSWKSSAAAGCDTCLIIAATADKMVRTLSPHHARVRIETLEQKHNHYYHGPKGDLYTAFVQWCTPEGEEEEFLEVFDRGLNISKIKERMSIEEACDLVRVCEESHPDCDLTVEILPKRLLDLAQERSSTSVKLVDCSSLDCVKDRKYAALSHCWGQRKSLRLVQSSLEQMQTGMAYEDLPTLFQDVVELTRALGLRYIWIDALCIVQGDENDWSTQSARMGDIFFNSHVTIAAASSKDSAMSLSETRHVARFDNISVDTSVICKRVRAPVMARIGVNSDSQPLHLRAWAFQEFLLSRRVLVIDHTGILLYCRSGMTQANRPTHSVDDLQVPSEYRRAWSRVFLESSSSREPAIIDKLLLWFQIVKMYTFRDLTRQSDILPAVSGLAAMYLRDAGPGEKYLAEMWQCDFLRCLSWAAGV